MYLLLHFQIINPTATIPLDATDDAATLGQLAQLAGAYNQTVDGFALHPILIQLRLI